MKEFKVEHPGAHRPTPEQYDEAAKAAKVGKDATVTETVNESGVATTYVVGDPEKIPDK